MGKEFVVKHIRLKHAARMEQELSKVGLACMGYVCSLLAGCIISLLTAQLSGQAALLHQFCQA